MLTRTQKSPYSVKNGIFVTTLNHLTPTKIHGVNFFLAAYGWPFSYPCHARRNSTTEPFRGEP